jgi:hypothetical protein
MTMDDALGGAEANAFEFTVTVQALEDAKKAARNQPQLKDEVYVTGDAGFVFILREESPNHLFLSWTVQSVSSRAEPLFV